MANTLKILIATDNHLVRFPQSILSLEYHIASDVSMR